ncbi:MAG TPA: FAD:protein FMN transferase [candidate division Zixibacteria bacterium]
MTRRRFVALGAMSALGALIPAPLRRLVEIPGDRYSDLLWSMGGWNLIEVRAHTSDGAAAAISVAKDAIRQIDRTFSVFDRRSKLSRINHDRGCHVAIDDQSILNGIAAALRWASASAGAFDPTVEPLMRRWGFREGIDRAVDGNQSSSCDHRAIELDLARVCLRRETPQLQLDSGGWAKGWAAGLAAQAALRHGAVEALVNCGGDIARAVAHGNPEWTCGIRNPAGTRHEIVARVRHIFPAAATSGDYENYRLDDHNRRIGHLMDPRSRRPAITDLFSATVFAHDALAADAMASALFVMGSARATRWLSAHPDFAAVLITDADSGTGLRIQAIGPIDLTAVPLPRG